MSDHDDRDNEPDPPRIMKVSRRAMLRLTAAGLLGGLAVHESPSAADTSKHESSRAQASEVRLFLMRRPFLSPVRELYPVFAGADSRLIALSEGGLLALWSFDEPDNPAFTGSGDCCPPPPITIPARPFRPPERLPSAVSEDGQVVAWLDDTVSAIEIRTLSGKALTLKLPTDRGQVECLGLGAAGDGLAVAFPGSGILVFDLRGAEPLLVGEFLDARLTTQSYCAKNEVCAKAAELPCACDLVGANGGGDEPL